MAYSCPMYMYTLNGRWYLHLIYESWDLYLQSKDLEEAKSELGIHWAVTAISSILYSEDGTSAAPSSTKQQQHHLQRDQADIWGHSLSKYFEPRNVNNLEIVSVSTYAYFCWAWNLVTEVSYLNYNSSSLSVIISGLLCPLFRGKASGKTVGLVLLQ